MSFYFSITIIVILLIGIPLSLWELGSQNYAFGDTYYYLHHSHHHHYHHHNCNYDSSNKIRIHKSDFHYRNSILTILLTMYLYK